MPLRYKSEPSMWQNWSDQECFRIKLLLDHKINPNKSFSSSCTVLQLLLEDENGYLAADLLKLLLRCGASTTTPTFNALHLIFTKILQEYNTHTPHIEPAGKIPRMSSPKIEVQKPKMYDAVLKTLLNEAKNLEVNFQDETNGYTVLHLALQAHVSTAYIEILMARGSNPYITDHEGISCIELAEKLYPHTNLAMNLTVWHSDYLEMRKSSEEKNEF